MNRADVIRTFTEHEDRYEWNRLYDRIQGESQKQQKTLNLTFKEAKKDLNRIKNRYENVLPFDQNRVQLRNVREGSTDYINASPLSVPFAKRKYILSQGPLEKSLVDFWQMIWEQDIRVIVMLNNIIEQGSLKCYPYFGTEYNTENDYGDFCVEIADETDYDAYTVRQLRVSTSNENLTSSGEHGSRILTQFHFTTWPDFGVPSETKSFLEFMEAVSSEVDRVRDGELDSPILVHCSAGIGRTGTFVVVDSMLSYFKDQGDKLPENPSTPEPEAEGDCPEEGDTLPPGDLHQFIIRLRKYRVGLIQTPQQLRFCWRAIVDWIKLNTHPDHLAVLSVPQAPRKRPSTEHNEVIEKRKQKIQEIIRKCRQLDDQRARSWFGIDRFWINGGVIAATSIGIGIAVYAYNVYYSSSSPPPYTK